MIQENTPTPTRTREANCDEVDWVRSSVRATIDMAMAMDKEARTGKNRAIFRKGVDGLVEGCVAEILKSLGMRPEKIVVSEGD